MILEDSLIKGTHISYQFVAFAQTFILKNFSQSTGIINTVSFKLSSEIGRLYENLVFIQLLSSGNEIYYWQDQKGVEVDFIIREGLKPVRLIQVCSNLSDPEQKNAR